MGDIETTYPPYNLVELYGLKHMRDKQEEKAWMMFWDVSV